jgi:hypothetical protein
MEELQGGGNKFTDAGNCANTRRCIRALAMSL